MDASLVGKSLFLVYASGLWIYWPLLFRKFQKTRSCPPGLIFLSCWMVHPREGKSAWFNSPGQCLHWCLFVGSRVSLTRCWRHCFQALLFLIQHNVVNKSVHSITSGVTLSDMEARKMKSINLASRFAPNKTRRGVICFLIGATQLLDAIRLTSTSPLWCFVQR